MKIQFLVEFDVDPMIDTCWFRADLAHLIQSSVDKNRDNLDPSCDIDQDTQQEIILSMKIKNIGG